jgi:hypothetical protein
VKIISNKETLHEIINTGIELDLIVYINCVLYIGQMNESENCVFLRYEKG